jgi:DNA-directed RNA polymerase subunit L
MSLIPNFPVVEGSKCQVRVQTKQPCKPNKAVDETHTTLLELMHSNICEMNGVLTKGYKFTLLMSSNNVMRVDCQD